VSDPGLRDFLSEARLRAIDEAFRPQYLIVFGSRVYGEPDRWSDIDLIVVSQPFRDIPRPERARTFTREICPLAGIDVLCYTPEEFERHRHEAGVLAEACERGLWIR
jgi:predicted nucleotidyltransferase